MAYWYAMQSVDYDTSIVDGILWTCEKPPGEKTPLTREYIKKFEKGDIVFHHSKAHLQALSVVTRPWFYAPRPNSHPRPEGEPDEGWKVKIRPIRTGLGLHFEDLARLIRVGVPGPLGANGHPQRRKFITTLTDEDGRRLLRHFGLEYLAEESLHGRPASEWTGDESDSTAITTVRNEQSFLRRSLLQGRTIAACALCQAELPDRFLIAGHIKPRALCNEEERKDYRAAMLVCSLGCDALFEWGYVVVFGPQGLIEPGLPTETEALNAAVDNLVGRRCAAFDEATAPRFEFHRS